jgi:hypothetical protein
MQLNGTAVMSYGWFEYLHHTPHIGRIPEENERFTIDGLQVTIVKASPRYIERVSIRRTPAKEAAGDRPESADLPKAGNYRP